MLYLIAAESLAYVLAAASLFAVWRWPTRKRISCAAFAIGLCFLLKAFRMAVELLVAL